jgi:WD40 repeat protein
MDLERVDSFPEFNLFFSPNWYSHQIADISPSGLCVLGCNDEVQLIDLQSRRPITSLFIRNPDTDKVITDINERKITAVLATDKFIVFTTVSGYLTVFEINSNSIICKFSDAVLQGIQISCIKELKPEDCELELMLTDNKAKIIFAKYKAGVLDQLNLEKEGNNHSTKNFEIINYGGEQFYAKIMDNGNFNIWTSYFEDVVFNVDTDFVLNTASFGVFDGMLMMCLLTRKNQVVVCQVGLHKVLDEFLDGRKFVYSTGANFRMLVKLEIEVDTPFLPANSLNKIKLRFHNRVVLLNDQRIIVTSRDGNMYLTSIESLMKVKGDKLLIKPAAYEDSENPFYEMLDENPHFKNIYFAKLINQTFVAIGMDRLVSFWKVNSTKIQYDFNIKCLGSKATRIAFSSLEPQTYLFPCNDRTMRIWNTGKKMNRYVTTILWKGLDKYRIRELEFHPNDDSMVALVCEKEVVLMDIHAHTVVCQFLINDLSEGEAAFARWMPREVVEKLIDSKLDSEIRRILKSQKNYKTYLNDKCNTKFSSKFVVLNSKYGKEIHKDFLFVVFIQNKGFFVCDFKLGTVFLVNFRIERFVSAVEVVDRMRENKAVLFFFGDKKGHLIVVRCIGNKFDSVFVESVQSSLISCIRANVNKINEDLVPQTDEPVQVKPEAIQSQSTDQGLAEGALQADAQKAQGQDPKVGDHIVKGEPSVLQKFYTKKDLVLATGSYDRTIKILLLKNAFEPVELKSNSVLYLLSFKHKFRVSELDWDPFDTDRLLNVCQKHVSVQVWTINPKSNPLKPPKSTDLEDDKYCLHNIRGHKGFITAAMWSRSEKNCIITCSDDQSIKIWNLINIKSVKPPNKKKKDNKMGQMIYEQDEEDEESEEEEIPPKKQMETFKVKKQYHDDSFIEEEDQDFDFHTPVKH